MISIEKAQELVDREIANDALRKHMLAVSELMGALADRMGIGEQEKQKQRGYNGVRRRTRFSGLEVWRFSGLERLLTPDT